MKKELIKIIIIFLIAIILPIPAFAQNQTCSYSVSDTASLLNVQNTIRNEILGGLSRNIIVCLNGGTYFLNSPLQFDSRDSGTGQYYVTYQSTSGQLAVISGGKIITTPWNKSDNIWTNTLNDTASFRHLYLDNTSLPRASQAFTIASVNGQQITVNEAVDFSNLSPAAEVLALGNFSVFREKIISGSSNTLTAATLMGLGSVDPTYWFIAPKVGQPLYVENDPKYLNGPGEWALSPSNNTLKYFPKSITEDPNLEQFIYPNLDQLLIINGSKNLKFNNLTFAHSRWTLPDQGYDGDQAGTYGTNGALLMFSLPSILTEFSSNLEFNSNTFWHLGSHGLALGQGSNNIKINGNLFTDIGGNSIMVGYRPEFMANTDWDSPSLIPKYNDITNNTVYSTANEMWDAVGIFVAFSGFTNISNNLIHDLPYSGISAGLYWGYDTTSMTNTTIQNNLIYHTCLKLNDCGGIYVLGNQPDSLMFNNAMTDIYPPDPTGFSVAGIYFDNGSTGWKVQENSTGNWWCSDCQPNHVPSDSPSNFNLVSNNVYGSVPPAIDLTQIGPQITPTPTTSPTVIPSSCPKKAQGDANCDGQVDSTDYFYYVAAVNGGQVPANVNPDINGDGEVGLVDRTIIIQSLSSGN